MVTGIERGGRRVLSRAIGRIAGARSRSAEPLDLARVRRVLFVRPNFRMGNLLLVTPALAALRRALPHAEIDVLATPAYRSLLRGNTDVDRVWTLARGSVVRPWTLAALLGPIRRRGYDLAIDAAGGGSLSGALLTAGSGARWTVGYAPSRHERLFRVTVPRDPRRRHVIDVLAGLLEGIGVPLEDPSMKVVLDGEEKAWARARWDELGLPADRPAVGVNVGARGTKRWPVERFLEVVGDLAGRGVPVVVFVGPQERDRLAPLLEGLPGRVAVDTTGDVRRFAALLARCAVVVTADTGPMHLAAAVGAPTVAVFLKGNAAAYAPLGPHHAVVEADAETGVAEVLERVAAALARPAG